MLLTPGLAPAGSLLSSRLVEVAAFLAPREPLRMPRLGRPENGLFVLLLK